MQFRARRRVAVDERAARGTEILDIDRAAAPLQRRVGAAHVGVVQAHVTGGLTAHGQVIGAKLDLAAAKGLGSEHDKARHGCARLGRHGTAPFPVAASLR
jgi:hypothetical protein